MKFFIIHGTGGHPEENWFPWLKKELEQKGHEVYVPDFPGIENQNLENWRDTFENYRSDVDKDAVFIAHSVGPAFVLNLLEDGLTVKACFFVSGFTGLLGNKFDEPNATITDRNFDFEEIKGNCGYFKLYHGSDDPYVPLEKAENLQQKLEAEIKVIENGGHLNEDAGFTEFPKLLEDLEEILGD